MKLKIIWENGDKILVDLSNPITKENIKNWDNWIIVSESLDGKIESAIRVKSAREIIVME